MVFKGQINAIDGQPVAIQADALLVHCDTVGSVAIAEATREALVNAGADLIPLR